MRGWQRQPMRRGWRDGPVVPSQRTWALPAFSRRLTAVCNSRAGGSDAASGLRGTVRADGRTDTHVGRTPKPSHMNDKITRAGYGVALPTIPGLGLHLLRKIPLVFWLRKHASLILVIGSQKTTTKLDFARTNGQKGRGAVPRAESLIQLRAGLAVGVHACTPQTDTGEPGLSHAASLPPHHQAAPTTARPSNQELPGGGGWRGEGPASHQDPKVPF